MKRKQVEKAHFHSIDKMSKILLLKTCDISFYKLNHIINQTMKAEK